MTARVLMVQGTQSDAGKSLFAAGLCRLLARRGVAVAPFKPQNMALNSAVTADGGEIGRAQALQAAACRLPPHTDMNPVLLKPNSERGSQVILQGRALGNMDARAYHDFKLQLRQPVLESFHRLAERFQVVIVEGAGSPAEVNLRERDIANMGFAELVDCPVVLLGDIDRGGVFAQLVGTLQLLAPAERARVKATVINKFRGDPALLAPGLEWLARETGVPVLGVMPFLPGLHLEAEDSFFDPLAGRRGGGFRVVVPRLPRLSNHTDLDPLRAHPGVDLHLVAGGEPIPPGDLVILPGSKSVRADLAWLRDQGWEAHLQRHLRYGGYVLGICGGYQMLGRRVADPHGIEGSPGESPGLGFLEVETVITPTKRLAHNRGRPVGWGDGALTVAGYEIHMGESRGPDLERPALWLEEGPHGARSADGRVMGCYLHGLLDLPGACGALLAWAGLEGEAVVLPDREALREGSLERLADALEGGMAWERLRDWLPGV